MAGNLHHLAAATLPAELHHLVSPDGWAHAGELFHVKRNQNIHPDVRPLMGEIAAVAQRAGQGTALHAAAQVSRQRQDRWARGQIVGDSTRSLTDAIAPGLR